MRQLNNLRPIFITLIAVIAPQLLKATQLSIGETYNIFLNPSLPSNAWITHASWSSSAIGLTCSDSGTWGTSITAVGYWSGSATVQCSYSYSYYGYDNNIHVGSSSSSWTFTCVGYPVSISETSINMDKGDSKILTFAIEGASLGTLAAHWTSSNENVATVYSYEKYSGIVRAKSPGRCTITCYSYMGEPVTCQVVVNSFLPSEITLEPEDVSIREGETATLSYTLLPEGASSSLTWESEDETIATVKSKVITGVSAGQTRVKVTTENGLSAYCNVTVIGWAKNPRGRVSTSLKGEGTEESPFLIETAADLRYLADMVNSGTDYEGQYFKQTADIMINNVPYFDERFRDQERWIPIGLRLRHVKSSYSSSYEYIPFCGHYDGDNHRISGIYMPYPDDTYESQSISSLAVFGCLSKSATIKNLRISNILIDDVYEGSYGAASAGLICVINAGDQCLIENCHVYNGIINGLAGIIYSSEKTTSNGYIVINRCSNSVDVTSKRPGGVILFSSGLHKIYNCINAGKLTGTSGYMIAGIHCMSDASIYNCLNAGDMTNEAASASGITGQNSKYTTIVDNCVNYGALDGTIEGGAIMYYKVTGSVTLSNNFYINDYSITPSKYKTNFSYSNNHGVTLEEMMSEGTLNTLNSTGNPEYDKWVEGPSGLPVLEWYNEICNYMQTEEYDAIPSVVYNYEDSYASLLEDTEISVYTVTGVLTYSGPKKDLSQQASGVYIIKSGAKVFKVMF